MYCIIHLIDIDYNQLISQLNMLPVGSDSYKMKEKRKRIEKELDRSDDNTVKHSWKCLKTKVILNLCHYIL